MNRSDTIGALAAALASAQAVMSPARKESTNPYFKSSYADLSSVWEACRKPLTDNGLSVVQTMDVPESGEALILETTLMHTSGEWVSGKLLMPPKAFDPQGIGSAITYARRYALAAMVGVCPEDDDAESAMSRQSTPKKQTSTSLPAQNKPAPTRPPALGGRPVGDVTWDDLGAEPERERLTAETFRGMLGSTLNLDVAGALRLLNAHLEKLGETPVVTFQEFVSRGHSLNDAWEIVKVGKA